MKVKTALLRIEDIVKEYNVSQKSIRRTIHSGALESNKVGGVHFIYTTKRIRKVFRDYIGQSNWIGDT